MIDKNNDFTCLMDLRVKPEDDRRVESGRSMVEMLGVLAVIGVLSVGGIAGYTYAMNKYYANELLAGASERAVLVTAQLASGREPNLREFAHYPNVGGTFGDAEELEDGNGFIILVSGVKGAVCENLIKATEGTDISIANNDESLSEATCDAENPNNLVFVFETGNGRGDNTSGCSATQIACGTGCCPTDAECVDNQCVLGEVTCAEGEDMYCYQTDSNGECISYDCCAYDNTGNMIIGSIGEGEGTYGVCADDENPFIYCCFADGNGCINYCTCPQRVSIDLEAEAAKTGRTLGGEVCCEAGSMALCDAVARDGNCDHYECYSISEGEKLTENFYGDLRKYDPL